VAKVTGSDAHPILAADPVPPGVAIEVNAEKRPNVVALSQGDRTTTWFQLEDRANRVANANAVKV